MTRRSIPENGLFRYICKDDTEQPFDNRLKSLNNLELSDFDDHNVEKRHVFVYDLMVESFVCWYLMTEVIISILI